MRTATNRIFVLTLTLAALVGSTEKSRAQAERGTIKGTVVDLNENGISDLWEVENRAVGIDPDGDEDGDGATNREEIDAGTDPFDAASRLGLDAFEIGRDGNLRMEWPAQAGKQYDILFNPGLDPRHKDWINLLSVSPSVRPEPIEALLSLEALPPGSARQGFFRLGVSDVDEDGDGLTARDEAMLGTSDAFVNSSGLEGRTDLDEALEWLAEQPAGPDLADPLPFASGGPGDLKEVDIAWLGGNPEGATDARLVTVAGTGGWAQLTSWVMVHGSGTPEAVAQGDPMEGHSPRVFALKSPVAGDTLLSPFVGGIIGPEGNFWLSSYHLSGGAIEEKGRVDYGSHAKLDVVGYDIAYRRVSSPRGDYYQVVVPLLVVPDGAPFHEDPVLRVSTWRIDVVSGALEAQYDSDLIEFSRTYFATPSVNVSHMSGFRFVLSQSTPYGQLEMKFVGVADNGFVNDEGGGLTGLNRSGTTSNLLSGRGGLASLASTGFVTPLKRNDEIRFHVWDTHITACDGGCYYSPFWIAGSEIDPSPDEPGLGFTPPTLTNSRSNYAAANDRYGSALAAGDFNGDGFEDIAVGVSGDNEARGKVDVMYGTLNGIRTATLTEQSWAQGKGGLPASGVSSDAFGTSLASGDFNGDGRDDLAIGIPYKDSALHGVDNSGAVMVIYGGEDGLESAGSQFWSLDHPAILSTPQLGELFGFSLAAGDFNGDGRDDLAAGIPGRDVSGAADAGAMMLLYGTAGSGLVNGGLHVWSQASTGVSDTPEAGDRFGSSLTTGDLNGDGHDELVVGVPYERVGGHDNAGAVQVFFGAGSGLKASGNAFLTQNGISGGGDLHEAAEQGDGFGTSLLVKDFNHDGFGDVAIGAPYEDLGAAKEDAGVVHVVYGSAGGPVAIGNQLLSQDALLPGGGNPPGAAEAGDQFGASLAGGRFNLDLFDDLIVGVKNEGLDDGPDQAGEILEINGSANGLWLGGAQVLSQDTPGMKGVAEEGDGFGSVLMAGDFDGDGGSELAVGTPDEDSEEENALGVVNITDNWIGGLDPSSDREWTEGLFQGVRGLLTDVRLEESEGEGAGLMFTKSAPGQPNEIHWASVTKNMTLMLAAEAVESGAIALSDVITISKEAADTGGSHMLPLLEEGDKLPLSLLLQGMMLRSGNKASVAIGEHISIQVGGVSAKNPQALKEDFIARMNAKAAMLGMNDTLYGHPAAGCVSHPEDQQKLWLAGQESDLFRSVASSPSYTGSGEDKHGNSKHFSFPKHSDGGYPGQGGWKGGNLGFWWNEVSPRPDVDWCTASVVSQVTRLDRTFLAVVNMSGDLWRDTHRLYDYAFIQKFTPDFRGQRLFQSTAVGNGGIVTEVSPVVNFAMDRVGRQFALVAMVDESNQLRLTAWKTPLASGGFFRVGSMTQSYKLPGAPRDVLERIVEVVRLPTGGDAIADYFTADLEDGFVRLKTWRLGASAEK